MSREADSGAEASGETSAGPDTDVSGSSETPTDFDTDASEASESPDSSATSGRDYALGVVGAIAVAALALRVVALGGRPFHWDEARVGYWALQYLETGAFQYRPVAGGPLLYHLDRVAFAAFGPSDRVARLPVAVVSAALPLAALLFRDRLDDVEAVVFAAVLAVQPVVLYYSRFLRGDVLLALFGLAAVGFALRAWDRRRRRDAYAAAVCLPLAASASGFVVGYLLCWAGAWLLVVDGRTMAGDGGAGARQSAAAVQRRLTGQVAPAARAGLLATAVTVLLFAPRSGSGLGVGLDEPSTVHLAVYEGTVGALRRFVGVRLVNRFPDGTHAILPYLGDTAGLLADLALPVVGVGAATTLWIRYATRRRPLVEGAGYWGLIGVVVFPMIAEVSAPWTLVHIVVPLSLPAAVGIVGVVRYGVSTAAGVSTDSGPSADVDGRGGKEPRTDLVDSDAERSPAADLTDAADRLQTVDAGTAVAVVLVVLAIGAQTGALVAGGVYGPSDRSNQLAQYAQPADDLGPIAAVARMASDSDPGTAEVVYVGSAYDVPAAATTDSPPVGDAWGNRLPVPWYVAAAGADATSTANVSRFAARYGDDTPPVVIADPTHRGALSDQLGAAYEPTSYRLGLWNREVVVFATDSAASDDGAENVDPTRPATGSPSPRSVPDTGSG